MAKYKFQQINWDLTVDKFREDYRHCITATTSEGQKEAVDLIVSMIVNHLAGHSPVYDFKPFINKRMRENIKNAILNHDGASDTNYDGGVIFNFYDRVKFYNIFNDVNDLSLFLKQTLNFSMCFYDEIFRQNQSGISKIIGSTLLKSGNDFLLKNGSLKKSFMQRIVEIKAFDTAEFLIHMAPTRNNLKFAELNNIKMDVGAVIRLLQAHYSFSTTNEIEYVMLAKCAANIIFFRPLYLNALAADFRKLVDHELHKLERENNRNFENIVVF